MIYYADVKKRVALPLKKNYQQYDARLKELLAEMRERLMRGEIPPIEKGQKCSGCSMKDMCMPKIRFSKGTKDKITEIVKACLLYTSQYIRVRPYISFYPGKYSGCPGRGHARA